jgi:putative ABC transport system permease protein
LKLGNSFAVDGNLITSDLTFLRIFKFKSRNPKQIDLGVINLKPGVDVKRVQKNLVANLPNDVKVLTKPEFIEFDKEH